MAVRASYVAAAGVAKQVKAAQKARFEETKQSEATSTPLQFVQNNYSPKALSPVDLYRQTNNQLSRARGVLRNNA